jgi:hypothetical protein
MLREAQGNQREGLRSQALFLPMGVPTAYRVLPTRDVVAGIRDGTVNLFEVSWFPLAALFTVASLDLVSSMKGHIASPLEKLST